MAKTEQPSCYGLRWYFSRLQWADNNRNETLTRSLVGWRFEWQCQAGTFTIAIQMALIAMPSFHCNFYRFIATRIANNRFIEHHCIITGSNASFFSQWQAMMVIKQWRKPKQLRMRLRGRWFICDDIVSQNHLRCRPLDLNCGWIGYVSTENIW